MSSCIALVLAIGAAQPVLDEIVVTGQRLPIATSDRVFSGLAVPDAWTDAGPAVRLDDALRGLGGIAQFRRAGSRTANPTSQGVTLRGLGGNAASRALVLLDGIPQDDPFGGWIAWPALGLEPASVLIQRGGGASLSGPGALTGAIVLTSPAAVTGIEAELSYGSFDTVAARGRAQWRGEGVGIAVSGLADRSDGFILIPPDQRGPVDVPAGSSLVAGSLRGALLMGDSAEVQTRIAAFRDRRDTGLGIGGSRTRALDASVRLVSKAGQDSWRYDVSGYVKDRTLRNSLASADSTRTSASLTLDQYAVPATGWGLGAELRGPETGPLALRFGADARWSSGETREHFRNLGEGFTRDRRAGGDSRILGGFIDALLRPRETVTLTAAARLDQWSLSDGARTERDIATGAPTLALTYDDRSQTRLSGRVGASLVLTPAIEARAAAYANTRAPTLNELYRPFRVGQDVTEANAQLGMERLIGMEAGLRYQPATGVVLDAALFWNRLDDGVANVTLGRGPGTFPLVGFLPEGGVYRQRLPIDRTRSAGVELWVRAPLGGGFSADASYSFAATKVTRSSVAPELEGLRPAQSPRHQLTARLDWRRAQTDAALGVQYTGRQYDDDANSRVLPAAALVNGELGWSFAPGWRLSAGIDNLFDARLVSAVSAAGIETLGSRRTLRLGLGARWR